MQKENQEKMFSYVKSWDKDKTSMKSYAHSLGLSRDKFEYWYRKYKRINNETKATASFIQLFPPTENRNKPVEVEQSKTSSSPKLELELTFPNGLHLKIYS